MTIQKPFAVIPYDLGTIATGNDTIRINHIFDRVDGTVLDAQVGFVDSWITW